jgi:hypothetical protein
MLMERNRFLNDRMFDCKSSISCVIGASELDGERQKPKTSDENSQP